VNDFARTLRKNQTIAEKTLWLALRDRRFLDLKFRRQHRLGHYIADFCCVEKKLIVEVDGGQHMGNEPGDAERTGYFQKEGYRVLRFWNNEVLGNGEAVLEKMKEFLSASSSSPSFHNGEKEFRKPACH
jgi:lysyl-tRNA synthetase class 2